MKIIVGLVIIFSSVIGLIFIHLYFPFGKNCLEELPEDYAILSNKEMFVPDLTNQEMYNFKDNK